MFKDGTYFQLTTDERALVDDVAEEICLSTRFLALFSNKLHVASKQELKNDLVKGDDKYPRTISATMNFLQHHSLRNKNMQHFENHKGNQNRLENSFAQNGEENGEEKMVKKVSQTCR